MSTAHTICTIQHVSEKVPSSLNGTPQLSYFLSFPTVFYTEQVMVLAFDLTSTARFLSVSIFGSHEEINCRAPDSLGQWFSTFPDS
jgi:hypothetical protein